MNAILEVVSRLQKYDAHYEVKGDTIFVTPASENGFTVSLTEGTGGYTVGFNGWHEEFTERREALNCFAWGLSRECRLKEWRRGGIAYKWAAESKEEGDWEMFSETGLLFFPFWRRSEIRYLQNDLLPSDSL